MDTTNPVIQLCIEGSQAEFEQRPADACLCYQKAWQASTNEYEACIAAHYLARMQATPEECLHWNQVALERAEAAEHELVKDFYPSLYLNLGYAFELLGNQAESQHFYDLAAELGYIHQP